MTMTVFRNRILSRLDVNQQQQEELQGEIENACCSCDGPECDECALVRYAKDRLVHLREEKSWLLSRLPEMRSGSPEWLKWEA